MVMGLPGKTLRLTTSSSSELWHKTHAAGMDWCISQEGLQGGWEEEEGMVCFVSLAFLCVCL